MPITFGSMAEFEAFCRAFQPNEQTSSYKAQGQPEQSAKAAYKTAQMISQPKAEKPARKTVAAPKPKRENSLTDQVKTVIQAFIDAKTAFSANDIYAKLSETNPEVNKPTVLSLSSKLLSTQYQLPSEERPSAGIRPMRVYLPEGS